MYPTPRDGCHKKIGALVATIAACLVLFIPTAEAQPQNTTSPLTVTIKNGLFSQDVIYAGTGDVVYIHNADPVTHELKLIPEEQWQHRDKWSAFTCKFGFTFLVLLIGILTALVLKLFKPEDTPTSLLRKIRRRYPRGCFISLGVITIALAAISASLTASASCEEHTTSDVWDLLQQQQQREFAQGTQAAIAATAHSTELWRAASTAAAENNIQDEALRVTAEVEIWNRVQTAFPPPTEPVEYEPLPRTTSIPTLRGTIEPIPPNGTASFPCNDVGIGPIRCETCPSKPILVVIVRERKPKTPTKTPTSTPSTTWTPTPTATFTSTSTPTSTPTDTPTKTPRVIISQPATVTTASTMTVTITPPTPGDSGEDGGPGKVTKTPKDK